MDLESLIDIWSLLQIQIIEAKLILDLYRDIFFILNAVCSMLCQMC